MSKSSKNLPGGSHLRTHPAYIKAIESAKRAISRNHMGAADKAHRWWEWSRLESMTIKQIVAAEKARGHKASDSTVSKYITAYQDLQDENYLPETRESAIAVIDGRIREILATIKKLDGLYEERDVKPPKWALDSVGERQSWYKSRMPLHSIFQSRLAAEAQLARYLEVKHSLGGLKTPKVAMHTGFTPGEKTQEEIVGMYDALQHAEAVELTETKTKRTVKIAGKDKPEKGNVIDVTG